MSSTPTYPPILESASIEPVASRTIAGFWRRLFAFIIDCFITSILCFVLGFFLPAEIGAIAGFLVTVTYFATLASYLGDGQTLGQRLLHVEVVGGDGQYLSFGRSYLRYVVLLLPLLGSEIDWWLPVRAEEALGYICTAGAAILVYLIIFNRSSKQTIHDLLTDSHVVEEGGYGKVNASEIWHWHFKIAILLAVLTVLTMIPAVQKKFMAHGALAELWTVQEAIVNTGTARNANVTLMTNDSDQGKKTGLRITVPKPESESHEEAAARIVRVVFDADPAAANHDYLAVIFNEGFAVGFARFSKSFVVSHSIEEWQGILRHQSGR